MSLRLKSSVRPSVRDFIEQLAKLRFDGVFNPYADICPEHDKADAPAIRRRNLAFALEAALNCRVESLWIARDLGYRGGRRTGLALTDDFTSPSMRSCFTRHRSRARQRDRLSPSELPQ